MSNPSYERTKAQLIEENNSLLRENKALEERLNECVGGTKRDLAMKLQQQRDKTSRFVKQLDALKEQNALLTVQVQEALTRMDRARYLLTDGNPRLHCNWGMLDTSDIKAALPQQVKSEDARECRWTPMDEENMPGTYEGTCGVAWSFTEGGIKENDTQFCPRCGGRVVYVASISAQD